MHFQPRLCKRFSSTSSSSSFKGGAPEKNPASSTFRINSPRSSERIGERDSHGASGSSRKMGSVFFPDSSLMENFLQSQRANPKRLWTSTIKRHRVGVVSNMALSMASSVVTRSICEYVLG